MVAFVYAADNGDYDDYDDDGDQFQWTHSNNKVKQRRES